MRIAFSLLSLACIGAASATQHSERTSDLFVLVAILFAGALLAVEYRARPNARPRNLGVMEQELPEQVLRFREWSKIIAVPKPPPSSSSDREDVSRLRSEMTRLRQERDILKAAATIFARESGGDMSVTARYARALNQANETETLGLRAAPDKVARSRSE